METTQRRSRIAGISRFWLMDLSGQRARIVDGREEYLLLEALRLRVQGIA